MRLKCLPCELTTLYCSVSYSTGLNGSNLPESQDVSFCVHVFSMPFLHYSFVWLGKWNDRYMEYTEAYSVGKAADTIICWQWQVQAAPQVLLVRCMPVLSNDPIHTVDLTIADYASQACCLSWQLSKHDHFFLNNSHNGHRNEMEIYAVAGTLLGVSCRAVLSS